MRRGGGAGARCAVAAKSARQAGAKLSRDGTHMTGHISRTYTAKKSFCARQRTRATHVRDALESRDVVYVLLHVAIRYRIFPTSSIYPGRSHAAVRSFIHQNILIDGIEQPPSRFCRPSERPPPSLSASSVPGDVPVSVSGERCQRTEPRD